MDEVWNTFRSELSHGFKMHCTQENNTTMSLHDFIRFLKDTKIAGARLSVSFSLNFVFVTLFSLDFVLVILTDFCW